MILSARACINSDGRLEYKSYLADIDTQVGDATELQYTVLKRAHKAFEEAVAQINDHLEREGMDKKLAALTSELRQVDEHGNIISL